MQRRLEPNGMETTGVSAEKLDELGVKNVDSMFLISLRDKCLADNRRELQPQERSSVLWEPEWNTEVDAIVVLFIQSLLQTHQQLFFLLCKLYREYRGSSFSILITAEHIG